MHSRTQKMTTWWALVLVLGIATGCGEDPIVTPDGGPGGDSGPTGDSGPRPDGGPTGDGNDSFATAETLTPGTTSMGAIATPGDVDYYTFTGTAGQWVAINTTANAEDDPAMIDTVITLYDSTMTQIAENDDAQPRASTDSELITRLPSAGTYYVKVQEWSTWAGEPDEGMASFRYELDITALAAGGAINVDAEGGDDLASAQDLNFGAVTGGQIGFVVGTSNDATDVDVYAFTVSAAMPLAQFTIMPAGADGYGSTGQPAELRITNAAGDDVIAQISTTTLTDIEPSLPAGDYLLWVDSPASTGANAFYVLKGFLSGDNPAEMSDPTNNLPATPEGIEFNAGAAPDSRVGFILARLGTADVDHFSIATTAGEVVNVFCGSLTSGSGVVGLTATVLDSTGTTTIGMATETATAPLAIEELAVPAAGTYIVRLTKASQSPTVSGDWVRCGIALAPPAPAP